MRTATIHAHPSDENILVLKTPPDMSTEMGKFEPARYDREHFAYLLHLDHLEALRKFAKRFGLYLIDQRQAPPGEKALMPECEHCGQPARLTDQPKRCQHCGKHWRPVFIGVENPHSPLQKSCVRCGHRQVRSFRYCGECGEVMPPDAEGPVRRIRLPRRNLDDPMPLSDAVREAVDDLDGPTVGEWAQLAKLEIRPSKAIDRTTDRARAEARATDDVHLPATEENA